MKENDPFDGVILDDEIIVENVEPPKIVNESVPRNLPPMRSGNLRLPHSRDRLRFPDALKLLDNVGRQLDLTKWEKEGKIYKMDADIKFLQDYVDETRGKHHTRVPKITLTKSYRVNHDNPDFPDNVPHKVFLMHGIHSTFMPDFMTHGFCDWYECGRSSKKALFGEGYYFTNCSTKAANWASHVRAYDWQHKADRGEIMPEVGDYGYIVFCEVSMGRYMSGFQPKLFRITLAGEVESGRYESLRCFPYYEPKRKRTVVSGNTSTLMGGNGWRKRQFDLDFLWMDDDQETYEEMRIWYPEYAVPDPSRIKMRYLVEFRADPLEKPATTSSTT